MGLQGLENAKKLAYYEYDFAKDGGAIGDKILRGPSLPAGAIITDTTVHVITAVTSGGAAMVQLSMLEAGDVLDLTAKDDLSLNALIDGTQKGAADNMIRMTGAGGMTATVLVATITAGKFVVAVEYIISD